MSQAGAHTRKRKFHRIGRHAAPSSLGKLGRTATRASRIVPAVALAGALVTGPHLYHLATASPSALTGDLASASRASLSHARPGSGHSPAGGIGAGPAHSPKPTSQTHPSSRRGQSSQPASTASPRAAAAHSPAPARTPTRTPSPAPASPACTGSGGGLLPDNYATIVSFLMAHGYSGLGAAGIAGNIYQESKGNPESVGSGGGGLIGWTPLPAGLITGNVTADLQTQLSALLTYNQQWAQYLPSLNAATSAAQAAYIYMTYFERPGIPVASSREGAAEAVAAACHL